MVVCSGRKLTRYSFSNVQWLLCRLSEEAGGGDTGWKWRTRAAHGEKDAHHNAGELFLSSAVHRRWQDWTHRQVCRALCPQSWQQESRLQELFLQDHWSTGACVCLSFSFLSPYAGFTLTGLFQPIFHHHHGLIQVPCASRIADPLGVTVQSDVFFLRMSFLMSSHH